MNDAKEPLLEKAAKFARELKRISIMPRERVQNMRAALDLAPNDGLRLKAMVTYAEQQRNIGRVVQCSRLLPTIPKLWLY